TYYNLIHSSCLYAISKNKYSNLTLIKNAFNILSFWSSFASSYNLSHRLICLSVKLLNSSVTYVSIQLWQIGTGDLCLINSAPISWYNHGHGNSPATATPI